MKDLTNAKEKLEGQIQEREETIAILKKKINGLVSSSVDIFNSEKIKRTFKDFPFLFIIYRKMALLDSRKNGRTKARLASLPCERKLKSYTAPSVKSRML